LGKVSFTQVAAEALRESLKIKEIQNKNILGLLPIPGKLLKML
jgi:hypothetical protein